jgi:hypothetical protein
MPEQGAYLEARLRLTSWTLPETRRLVVETQRLLLAIDLSPGRRRAACDALQLGLENLRGEPGAADVPCELSSVAGHLQETRQKLDLCLGSLARGKRSWMAWEAAWESLVTAEEELRAQEGAGSSRPKS